MKTLLIFALSFHFLIVLAQPDDSTIIIIPAVIIPSFFVLCLLSILLRWCFNKRNKQRHPVRYVNNSNEVTRVALNDDWRAHPSNHFQSDPQHFQPLPNHHTQVTIDRPPPYSDHMYHTHASGQPMISGNVMHGLDNSAFLNSNISKFSNPPNM